MTTNLVLLFSKFLPNLMHIYYSKRTSGSSKLSFNESEDSHQLIPVKTFEKQVNTCIKDAWNMSNINTASQNRWRENCDLLMVYLASSLICTLIFHCYFPTRASFPSIINLDNVCLLSKYNLLSHVEIQDIKLMYSWVLMG